MAVSILLGPEGTTTSRRCRRLDREGSGSAPGEGVWWLLFQPGMTWFSYRSVVVVPACGLVVAGAGLVGAGGLWVGRWLRIAQWTRASCFLWCLSCQGRTVDALAPGADEGRGRPR